MGTNFGTPKISEFLCMHPHEQDNQKGVMYHEYDLMFHYLLASLPRADGKNSVTATGTKLFDIFAGLGEHR